MHRCLWNGGFNYYVVHFDRSFDGMAEHRWQSMTRVMAWLIPLRGMLCEAWSAGQFGRYQSREDDISVDKIDQAIKSRWFWLFCTRAVLLSIYW